MGKQLTYRHYSLVNPEQNIPQRIVYYVSWPDHKVYAIEHVLCDQQHMHSGMLVHLWKKKVGKYVQVISLGTQGEDKILGKILLLYLFQSPDFDHQMLVDIFSHLQF